MALTFGLCLRNLGGRSGRGWICPTLSVPVGPENFTSRRFPGNTSLG